jgi:hypothetical protein
MAVVPWKQHPKGSGCPACILAAGRSESKLVCFHCLLENRDENSPALIVSLRGLNMNSITAPAVEEVSVARTVETCEG